MLRADDIRIPENEQNWRLDPLNSLGWPVRELAVEFLRFGDKGGKMLGVRCDAGVFLLERGSSQPFRLQGIQSLHQPWMEPAIIVANRGQHYLEHDLWMHPGDLHGDASTVAIAEEVCFFDADLVQES